MSEVKIYSTPTCSWCVKAKDFLKEKKVSFKDLDVSSDSNARDEMLAKSGQMGVPVIDIDGNVIVGFDQDAIKDALGG